MNTNDPTMKAAFGFPGSRCDDEPESPLGFGNHGCGNHGCKVNPPKGAATNGQCRCSTPEDRRLAQLPEDLRKVAAEFLTLHDAWGTEFEVNSTYCLAMEWRSETHFARLEWYDRTWADEHRIFWNIFAREMGNDFEKLRVDGSGPIRRSHDFAEFVQRFKK